MTEDYRIYLSSYHDDDDDDIEICLLNVRGLGNSFKRRCIFNWIRNSDYHLILLQETHSTEKTGVKNGAFIILFSHGRSESAVVCILLKPSVSFDILNVTHDDSGRILLVILKVNDTPITVANVYGPNNDDAAFMLQLHSMLNEIGEEPFIIGGDFKFSSVHGIQNHTNHDIICYIKKRLVIVHQST